ncbi:MAG: UDP-2,3-diacylglucosamine diphosphatase LpxI [Candidatus Omnitrophota bacterium]|nr:UDP-2,3-diacylglucosamine diphosphatase LpxI [Candidatus Omnitrophota bacterium]
MNAVNRIGLLAGEGELPIIFADEARKNGATVIAFAAKEIASPELRSHVDKIYWLDLPEVKKLPFMLFINRIKHLVMLGKVPKSIFFKKDFSKSTEISSLLQDTRDRLDDSILREVSNKLKKFGLTFISPAEFLYDLMPKKGTLTKREPMANEWEDIKFGREMAMAIGKLDIGQTVVVKNKAVLAVEAIEGTDETIKRAGKFSKGGTVIVKVMKPAQDPRFDIPAVGIETINSLVEAKASVLAIEADKTIFINREESLSKADANNISIVAV